MRREYPTETPEPWQTRESLRWSAPVIIGGLALSYYSREVYLTADIDLACADRDTLDAVLTELGFARKGRHWIHETLDMAAEAPATTLAGEDAPREEDREGRTRQLHDRRRPQATRPGGLSAQASLGNLEPAVGLEPTTCRRYPLPEWVELGRVTRAVFRSHPRSRRQGMSVQLSVQVSV